MAFTLDSLKKPEKGPNPADPNQYPEATPWNNFRAGIGSALMDVVQGGQQLFGGANEKDVAEKRKVDAPLLDTTAGKVGQFVGQVAPALAVPATGVVGAAALGGVQGALQPVGEGESRAENAGLGTLFGAGGAAGAKLVGKALSPFKSNLTPEAQALAARAKELGIPLTAGQETGNIALRTIESQLQKMPGSSGKAIQQAQDQGRAFTGALLKTAGAEGETSLAEGVMGSAKAKLGDKYNELFRTAEIQASDFTPRLQLIKAEAVRNLPPDKARVVANKIEDLADKIDKDTIEGIAYQKWRSTVKSADGDVQHYLKAAKQAVDDAAAAALGPDAMAAFEKTNLQYKNLKTLAPLAEKSSNGLASPALVLERVRAANPNMAFTGAGEIGDLAKIGQQFLKDLPDSNTAQRVLAQTLLSGGMGGGAYAATGDPFTALKAAGGTYASTVLGPKLAQALLQSKGGQHVIKHGVAQNVDPRLIEALRRGSVALPMAAGFQAEQ